MKVQDAKGFSVGVTLLKKRSGSINGILGGCMEFAYRQALDNGNSSPFMVLREVIPTIAKPTGCSMKGLDSFIEEYAGFTWNKETKSYKKEPGTNVRMLPGAEGQQHCRFWEYATERAESREYNVDEAMDRLIAKAVKQGGWTMDSITERFVEKVAASSLSKLDELAATLGIAA